MNTQLVVKEEFWVRKTFCFFLIEYEEGKVVVFKVAVYWKLEAISQPQKIVIDSIKPCIM